MLLGVLVRLLLLSFHCFPALALYSYSGKASLRATTRWQHRYCNTALRAASVETEDLHLTPVLEGYANGLRNVPDDKLRYKQLLFLASKCAPMNDALKVPVNKVPGCLSTVYVHATMDTDGKVHYLGDSDSQLTKGLVAMLVNGLSGHTPQEIDAVDPAFIKYAGIANSLTPGRNNGFLNMMNLMKLQARKFNGGASTESTATATSSGLPLEAGHDSSSTAVGAEEATSEIVSETATTPDSSTSVDNGSDGSSDISSSSGGSSEQATEIDKNKSIVSPLSVGSGPVFQSIIKKLSMLQPSELLVIDESHKHAGHAGIAGVTAAGSGDGPAETHFNVKIVAACFEGLSRVQRHQMVYTLLAQELKDGVHALSIAASTPSEV